MGGFVNVLSYSFGSSSNEVCKNAYENLLAWVGESVTDYKPHLSTLIPSQENGLVSADGLVYSFPIRKHVKFHNGNDLTPEDIEYTYERAMIFDRAGGPSWMILEPLTGYSTIESIVEAEGGVPTSTPTSSAADSASVSVSHVHCSLIPSSLSATSLFRRWMCPSRPRSLTCW